MCIENYSDIAFEGMDLLATLLSGSETFRRLYIKHMGALLYIIKRYTKTGFSNPEEKEYFRSTKDCLLSCLLCEEGKTAIIEMEGYSILLDFYNSNCKKNLEFLLKVLDYSLTTNGKEITLKYLLTEADELKKGLWKIPFEALSDSAFLLEHTLDCLFSLFLHASIFEPTYLKIFIVELSRNEFQRLLALLDLHVQYSDSQGEEEDISYYLQLVDAILFLSFSSKLVPDFNEAFELLLAEAFDLTFNSIEENAKLFVAQLIDDEKLALSKYF